MTILYLPLLFLIVGIFIGKESNMYLYISSCFILLLLNDFLFRFFGSGTIDDADKGQYEIAFSLTVITTTVSLLYLKIITNNKLKIDAKQNLKLILSDILFVSCLSMAILFLFKPLVAVFYN
jgi:nitric oxide reductase large subunit